MPPSSSPPEAAHVHRDSRRRQILAEQVRLLYCNANVAIGVTLVATAILGHLQWGVVPHLVILGWCLYMFLVSVGRFTLKRRYWRAKPSSIETRMWGAAFAIGAGLAGAGWGAAGILLYPEAHLANQVILVFILGGMILGAASVLAPRPEAFLAFIVPTGLAPAVRLMVQGDEAHVAMGLLASLFTLATLITTRRIHLTISSSLNLQFENQDLVEDLQAAKNHAEALNVQLEVRVQERTAELHRLTERLRTEIKQREQVEEELLTFGMEFRILTKDLEAATPSGNPFKTFSTDPEARIDQLAMSAVRLAEEARGCRVVDVSAQKCGWDITSYEPTANGRVPDARHIKVKGRVKGASTVTVTKNEIFESWNQGAKYYLAIVLIGEDESIEGIHYVPHPFKEEPGWGVSSVNYELKALLGGAEAF
jgi:Domain of unknown function (DUF3883)